MFYSFKSKLCRELTLISPPYVRTPSRDLWLGTTTLPFSIRLPIECYEVYLNNACLYELNCCLTINTLPLNYKDKRLSADYRNTVQSVGNAESGSAYCVQRPLRDVPSSSTCRAAAGASCRRARRLAGGTAVS